MTNPCPVAPGEDAIPGRRAGRSFACREDRGSSYGEAADLPGSPGAEAPVAPSPAYPAERSLRAADGLAVSLRGGLHRILVPLAAAARRFVELRGWTTFGHARLEDHARERFGRSARWVQDLARLGAAMGRLPGLAAAVTGEDGGPPVGAVAARLIGGVADEGSLPAWIERARTLPLRELRRQVSAAQPDEAGREGRPAADGVAIAGDDPGAEPWRQVTLAVPVPLRPAFDEALDLYRAVEGREATVTSFVEALVAEGLAGDAPFDVATEPLRAGQRREAIETAFENSTDSWAHLAGVGDDGWALALAGSSLARLDELAAVAGRGGPAALDGQIHALLRLHDELDARLGRLLHEMGRRGAWSRLRFAGVGHYAERRLGLSRTAAEDRARLAGALERRPVLRRAHEEGRVGYEAARCVVRILGRGPVDRSLEEAWVARAAEATVKRLRDEERDLSRRGQRGRGAPLDDDAWHRSLRRGPGTARRRLLRLGLEAAGAPVADVFLRLRLPPDLVADLLASIEAARSALAAEVERVPWDEPWPEDAPLPSVVAARMFSIRCRRVPAWVGLLRLLEEFVLTWDPLRSARRPAVDAVFIRDGWRCMAPGCTSRRNLEDHHVIYRSRRGCDCLWNRVCLCRFHHQRGEHGGLLRCRGRAPTDLTWRLGTAEVGRTFRNERGYLL